MLPTTIDAIGDLLEHTHPETVRVRLPMVEQPRARWWQRWRRRSCPGCGAMLTWQRWFCTVCWDQDITGGRLGVGHVVAGHRVVEHVGQLVPPTEDR